MTSATKIRSNGNVLTEGQHWRGKIEGRHDSELVVHLDKGALFDGRAEGLAQLVDAGAAGGPFIVDGQFGTGRLDCHLLDAAGSVNPLQLSGMLDGDTVTGILTDAEGATQKVLLHNEVSAQVPAPPKPPEPSVNDAIVSYEVETNIGYFEFTNWSFAVVVPLGTWRGRELWGHRGGNVTIVIDPCAPISEIDKWHMNFDLTTWYGAPVGHFYALRGEIAEPEKWATLLPGSCAWPDDRWVDVTGRMIFHRRERS